MRAVAHLHVHHALLGLRLDELIGNPLDGLPAASGKGREGLGTTFPKSLGSSRSNKAVPHPGQIKPTSGPQPQILGYLLEKILEAWRVL